MRKKLLCCILLSVAFFPSHAQPDFDFEQRDSIFFLKIGIPFPDFTLTNTSGDVFSEKDMKGKITVINFWFKSCIPCIAELSALNKLFLKFKDHPDFLLLSFTTDSHEIAKEAINKFNILFDVYPTTKKECDRLFCMGFPTSIIIDKLGTILFHHVGGHTEKEKVAEYFEELEDKIDNLLK